MSTAAKGGAERPSLLRALFARLRGSRDPALPAPVTAPPVPPPADAAAVRVMEVLQPRAAPPRQVSLLEPSAELHGNRMLVIHDFVERFRQLVRRQGIGRGDPLAPVLDMLAEMLVHFSGVGEDLRTDLAQVIDRRDSRFLGGLEQARIGLGEEAGRVERAMGRATGRMETIAAETRQQRADVLGGFTAETEKLLRATVIRQAGVRIWCDRIIAIVFMAAAIAGAFWLGHAWGQAQGEQQMRAAIDAATPRFTVTLLDDGLRAGLHWLDLMGWNHLETAPRSCAAQRTETGYRRACTYTFWDDPPPKDPPRR